MGVDPGQGVLFPDGLVLLEIYKIREKSHEKCCASAFKADHTTSKRIRYGFITVKSITLIGLNRPRKNTTLPVIKCIEPGRTHILVQIPVSCKQGKCKIRIVSQGPMIFHHNLCDEKNRMGDGEERDV
ncbi:hypothetical protein TNCV_140841 [Trichonephila clavipes]|nr:hypothetical protein TNCV_140841 [Trichonephila clavipes]